MFIPSVSSAIFASWSCESYGYVDEIVTLSGQSEDATTRAYLRADLSIICGSATYKSEPHERLLFLAYILIGMWPIGVTTVRGAEPRGRPN